MQLASLLKSCPCESYQQLEYKLYNFNGNIEVQHLFWDIVKNSCGILLLKSVKFQVKVEPSATATLLDLSWPSCKMACQLLWPFMFFSSMIASNLSCSLCISELYHCLSLTFPNKQSNYLTK